MMDDNPSSSDREHWVLTFRRRPAGGRRRPPLPANDFGKYERGHEPDDYRHRMIVNALAFLFVAALGCVGLWLADSLAELRRNQDCALSGRTNCMPIEVNKSRF
jgi:hypothetical protein